VTQSQQSEAPLTRADLPWLEGTALFGGVWFGRTKNDFHQSGLLMAFGAWLHLSERHVHDHTHNSVADTHRHIHDEHHQHVHDSQVIESEPHSHTHRHEPLTHSHPLYPDLHHRHTHG
jgi:hypothetical protein